MTITLRGRIPVTVASAYSPTAIATAEDKDSFYTALKTLTRKYKKKGILYVGADLNAKLIDPGDYDDGIGPHIFGAGQPVDREESQGVEDNRSRLQEHLIITNSTLANTLFPKQPQNLITYRLDKTIGNAPPYNTKRYSTIDYFLTHKQWRNSIRNIYSDMQAGIDTDHFPLIMTVRIKLKAEYGTRTFKPKYLPCDEEQRLRLNSQLTQRIPENHTHTDLTDCMLAAAEATMTMKTPNPPKPVDYSEHTETLLSETKATDSSWRDRHRTKRYQEQSVQIHPQRQTQI